MVSPSIGLVLMTQIKNDNSYHRVEFLKSRYTTGQAITVSNYSEYTIIHNYKKKNNFIQLWTSITRFLSKTYMHLQIFL